MKKRFLRSILVICFLLVAYCVDSVISALLYFVPAMIRNQIQFPFSDFIILKVFSLFAVALTGFGFGFGFSKQINSKLAGIGSSLYLLLLWLIMLHAIYFELHLSLKEAIVIYNSLMYIVAMLMAYFVGFFFCGLSKKCLFIIKNRRQQ